MFLATASFVVFGLALMAGLYNFVFGKKPKSLAGRHVLVTGGSAGIGRAVANQAASAGANVTIVARNLDRLKETAEAVKTHFVNPEKQKVHIISTDISSRVKYLNLRLASDQMEKCVFFTRFCYYTSQGDNRAD